MSELFTLTDAFACFISVDNVQGKCRSAVSFFFLGADYYTDFADEMTCM